MNKYLQVISFWNIYIFIFLSFVEMDNVINCFTTYNHCVWICEMSKTYILWLISALVMIIHVFDGSIQITKNILKE